jgi:tRNA (guanine37-N1)-methyltransferase
MQRCLVGSDMCIRHRIAAGRKQRAIDDTRLRRPDLIERHGGAQEASPSGAQNED